MKEMKALKINQFLSILLVLTTLLMPLFAEPCSAAFLPSYNITLEREGMSWGYSEYVTDIDATSFRKLIDSQEGDSNNFVNAWEILKAELFMRDKMQESIEQKPDIKLNGTSENVKTVDIDFRIPEEALGKTEKNSSIVSSASVSYIFDTSVSSGTDIWLIGTPNSSITITLPAGFNATKTEGLENKSIGIENNRIVLRGNFSSEKNITIWLSENESFKAELQSPKENRNKSVEKTSVSISADNKENNLKVPKDSSGLQKSLEFFKNLFAQVI